MRSKLSVLKQRGEEKLAEASRAELQNLPTSGKVAPLKTPSGLDVELERQALGLDPRLSNVSSSRSLVPDAGPRLTQKETEEATAALQRQFGGGDSGKVSQVALQAPDFRAPADFSYQSKPKDWGQAKINFKEGREFLSAFQDTVFKKDTLGNYTTPGAETVAGIIGGGEGQIRNLLDKKAAAAGSSLPEINAERSKIMELYNQGVSNFKPETITRAFLGGKSGTDDMLKIQTLIEGMDETLGTNSSKDIQSGAFQRVIERMFEKPSGAFGSGGVNKEAISAGFTGMVGGAATGAGAGAMIAGPAGALPGAVLGGVAGAAANASRATALASPQDALRYIAKSGGKIDALTAKLAAPATLSAPARIATTVGVGDLGEALGSKVSSQPEEEKNPFITE
jgi:hypothetical protein